MGQIFPKPTIYFYVTITLTYSINSQDKSNKKAKKWICNLMKVVVHFEKWIMNYKITIIAL